MINQGVPYLPPEGPPLCWVWNVDWLNLVWILPLGPETLWPVGENEGLPKFKVGILGGSITLMVSFAFDM